jgi:hypothetical protein
MAISEMNPITVDRIKARMKAAMAEIEREFGISINLGGAQYTEKTFTMKVGVAIKSDDFSVSDVDPTLVQNFMRFCESFGMTREDLNKREVKLGTGDIGVVVGLRPRAKLPIIVRSKTNNKFYVVKREALKM